MSVNNLSPMPWRLIAVAALYGIGLPLLKTWVGQVETEGPFIDRFPSLTPKVIPLVLILGFSGYDIGKGLRDEYKWYLIRSVVWYKFTLLLAGLACIVGGMWMVVVGITDEVNIIIENCGFVFKLEKASPGIFMTVVGFGLVWMSRFEVKVK